jgi:hypothetical protein
VNFFGGRIASLITMITVFVSSAATGITSALADREVDEVTGETADLTAGQFLGVGAGVYAGGVATKVASGNIKFAYGVQVLVTHRAHKYVPLRRSGVNTTHLSRAGRGARGDDVEVLGDDLRRGPSVILPPPF